MKDYQGTDFVVHSMKRFHHSSEMRQTASSKITRTIACHDHKIVRSCGLVLMINHCCSKTQAFQCVIEHWLRFIMRN